MFASWNPSQPEITDLIVQHDPHTLQRVKVRKREVLDTFSRYSNRQAMRAVEGLPEQEGILDEKEIDGHLLKVHWEMQRLAEEFYHGHRVWELLRVVIASIRKAGVREIIRIVDVGCGIGYVIRWLAANIPLRGYSVELLGMELNGTLISEADRLANAEELPCRFLHGDAFSKEHPGQIFISTGVIHHFRGQELLTVPWALRATGDTGTSPFRFSAVVVGAGWRVVFSLSTDAYGCGSTRWGAFRGACA